MTFVKFPIGGGSERAIDTNRIVSVDKQGENRTKIVYAVNNKSEDNEVMFVSEPIDNVVNYLNRTHEIPLINSAQDFREYTERMPVTELWDTGRGE